MNKAELVDYMKENSEGELNKKLSDLAVDLVFAGIAHALSKGEKVQLVGDITIEPVGRKARKGRNPQTGEEIEIAPRMGLKVKPGKNLEKAIAGLDVNKFLQD